MQSQLEAQITRTSLLQRRLNDTLDTLDALTQSHDQEVATLTYSNKRLRRKLDQYIEYARNLESERDQLREGARQIVEQGTCLLHPP